MAVVMVTASACQQVEVCCHAIKEAPRDEKAVADSSELGLFPPRPLCDYTQAFGNATHTGIACPELRNMRLVDVVEQDPGADAKVAAAGFLQHHLPAVLTFGDWVVIPTTSGFTTVGDRSTERYHVKASRWYPNVLDDNAVRNDEWELTTDWQPVNGAVGSLGYVTNGYVQGFYPAIGNGSVYVPASSGKLVRAELTTGRVQATINPFAGTPFDGDSRLTVNNALAVAPDGTVIYTAVAWPLGTPGPALRGVQARGTWLIAVRPDDTFRRVNFDDLAIAAGLPGLSTQCEYPFLFGNPPFPTGPDSMPPQFGCGKQRPAINAAVSVDPRTGYYVVFSYANNAQGSAHLMTVDPLTMTPVNTSDTQGHLRNGCGVRLTIDPDDDFNGCATITANGTVNVGNDPNFNGAVRFRGEDLMDSTPTVAPNGDRCVGSYLGGFIGGGEYDARGAGVCFSSAGAFRAKNERHWWEVTPSVWQHDGTFSYLLDEQAYSDVFEASPGEASPLTISQNDPNQNVEASHVIPLPLDDPDFPFIPFTWLDANIAFGPGGDRYAVNANGHLYKFQRDSKGPVESVPLIDPRTGEPRAVDTLSSYVSRDRKGRVYQAFGGFVWIIESNPLAFSEPSLRDVPLTDEQRAGLDRGRRMKAEALRDTPVVDPPTR